MSETLCWTCTAPGTGRCSWDRSKGNIPVDGWTAERTKILMQGIGYVDSYCVIDCPLYQECETANNAPRSGPRSNLDDETLEKWLYIGYTDREISRRSGLSVSTISQRRQKLARERSNEE